MKTQKDFKTTLVEYCQNLSDEDLRFLGSRLNDRYQDDMSEALNSMSTNPALDNIFQTTISTEEIYKLCDLIGEMTLKEAKKRKLNIWGTSDLKNKTKK